MNPSTRGTGSFASWYLYRLTSTSHTTAPVHIFLEITSASFRIVHSVAGQGVRIISATNSAACCATAAAHHTSILLVLLHLMLLLLLLSENLAARWRTGLSDGFLTKRLPGVFCAPVGSTSPRGGITAGEAMTYHDSHLVAVRQFSSACTFWDYFAASTRSTYVDRGCARICVTCSAPDVENVRTLARAAAGFAPRKCEVAVFALGDDFRAFNQSSVRTR